MTPTLISIAQLLPYDSKCIFKKLPDKICLLKLLHFIAINSKKAAHSIIAKKHEYFDPHVGDTCCQVRASYLNYIGNSLQQVEFKRSLLEEYNNIVEFTKRISILIEELEAKLKTRSSHYDRSLDGKENLVLFLKKLHVEFSFSETMVFLTTAYILCRYAKKDQDAIPYAINFEEITQSLEISSTLTKKVIQLFQRWQSLLSCNFLTGLSTAKRINHLEQIILPLIRKQADEGRVMVPCFEGMKLILNNIKYNGELIVLIVHRTSFGITEHIAVGCYYNRDKGKEVIVTDLNEFPSEQLCIAIHGTCNTGAFEPVYKYVSKLLEHGVNNILLANMAKHPQFSGSKLEHLKENPYIELSSPNGNKSEVTLDSQVLDVISQYQTMRLRAETIGACKENPSLFYIKHVFSDCVENVISWVMSKKVKNQAEQLFKQTG